MFSLLPILKQDIFPRPACSTSCTEVFCTCEETKCWVFKLFRGKCNTVRVGCGGYVDKQQGDYHLRLAVNRTEPGFNTRNIFNNNLGVPKRSIDRRPMNLWPVLPKWIFQNIEIYIYIQNEVFKARPSHSTTPGPGHCSLPAHKPVPFAALDMSQFDVILNIISNWDMSRLYSSGYSGGCRG